MSSKLSTSCSISRKTTICILQWTTLCLTTSSLRGSWSRLHSCATVSTESWFSFAFQVCVVSTCSREGPRQSSRLIGCKTVKRSSRSRFPFVSRELRRPSHSQSSPSIAVRTWWKSTRLTCLLWLRQVRWNCSWCLSSSSSSSKCPRCQTTTVSSF